MIAIDPVSVLLAGLFALAGVLVGRKIQDIVNFIFPIDPVTVAVLILPCAFTVGAEMAGMGNLAFLLVCFILFYFIGYYFNGRQDYRYLASLGTGGDMTKFRVKPWVIYENEDGQVCRQDQNWKALWNKWRWNIHHIIQTNADLEPKVELDVEPLIYPPITGKMIFAEYVHDSQVEWTVKKSKKMVEADGKYVPAKEKKVMQTVTTVILADTAELSSMQLLMKVRAFSDLSRKYTLLQEENFRLNQAVGSQSLYAVGDFIKQIDSYSPHSQVLGAMGYTKDREAISTEVKGAEQ